MYQTKQITMKNMKTKKEIREKLNRIEARAEFLESKSRQDWKSILMEQAKMELLWWVLGED
jgi:hypothetical protein